MYVILFMLKLFNDAFSANLNAWHSGNAVDPYSGMPGSNLYQIISCPGFRFAWFSSVTSGSKIADRMGDADNGTRNNMVSGIQVRVCVHFFTDLKSFTHRPG
jgi:hypothetical protein